MAIRTITSNACRGLCGALILSLSVLAGTAGTAEAQVQIRGRVVLLVDTSGSMLTPQNARGPLDFDEQGLRTGTPGEFVPFAGVIEGYQHSAGTRNIIRVKRFQPDAAAPPVLVSLDMVVESESKSQ